jgi:hypothetical protein
MRAGCGNGVLAGLVELGSHLLLSTVSTEAAWQAKKKELRCGRESSHKCGARRWRGDKADCAVTAAGLTPHCTCAYVGTVMYQSMSS